MLAQQHLDRGELVAHAQCLQLLGDVLGHPLGRREDSLELGHLVEVAVVEVTQDLPEPARRLAGGAGDSDESGGPPL